MRQITSAIKADSFVTYLIQFYFFLARGFFLYPRPQPVDKILFFSSNSEFL